MPATYDSIARTTLGSTTSSIIFSGISSGFTDLRLVVTGSFSVDSFFRVRFNGDSGSNYSQTVLSANQTGLTAGRNVNGSNIFFGWDLFVGGNVFMVDMNLLSYSGSTNKTQLNKINNSQPSAGLTEINTSLWRSTSAINQIEIYSSNTTFAAGTTASLYGILRA
jgi:hypothetical protein